MRTKLTACFIAVASTFIATTSFAAPSFTYDPPGQLVSGSGKGRVDTNVYAPDMLFPMKEGEAFANSQVWGRGGMNGGGGTQCDAQNFSYPWHDNYCETRSWDMPLCPSGAGHQGQDIRASDCKDKIHPVVAAVDGRITNVGTYSVYLTAEDGTRYDYLHMANVAVKEGDRVQQGQQLGLVSNQFNGEATTIHLHFNIKQNVAGVGSVYVPTYLSLVTSYEYHLGIKTRTPDAGPPPPPPPVVETPVVKETPLPAEEPPAPPPEDSGCACGNAAPNGTSLFIVMLVGVGSLVRRRRARGSIATWS
jgi:murein DD-endopeptidase MepM/ murein hydrolase activator NlpD